MEHRIVESDLECCHGERETIDIGFQEEAQCKRWQLFCVPHWDLMDRSSYWSPLH